MTVFRTRWWHAHRQTRNCPRCGFEVEYIGRKKRSPWWGCPGCGYALPTPATVHASQVDAVTEAWPRRRLPWLAPRSGGYSARRTGEPKPPPPSGRGSASPR